MCNPCNDAIQMLLTFHWMLLIFQSGSFCFEGPDEVVGPEGMEKFCEDIGVQPENVGFYNTSNPLKGVTGLVDLVLYTNLKFSK